MLAGTANAHVHAEFRVAGSSAQDGRADGAARRGGRRRREGGAGRVRACARAHGPSSSASGVAIGLGAALGALCLGGLVAFTVMRKRKAEADLLDIEMVEDYVHSENHGAEYSPVRVSRM